jgi:heme/copper-type cytochrome/quinol oxidase subunit 3
VHLFWPAPFFLSLGIFMLWSSNAIAEGTTSKISLLPFFSLTNHFLLGSKIIVHPLFHSTLVRRGFKIGFILFIVSEIMFFFGFFWAFFHSAVSPTIQIGGVWPPVGVEFITVKGFAIANTVILLTSGATLTVAHYAFELIPQKWTTLHEKKIPFVESEESFEARLLEDYQAINFDIFNGAKPEIFWINFLNKFTKFDEVGIYPTIYSVIFPLNIFLNPGSRYFTRNFALVNTDRTIRIYINLMLDATLLLAILFMSFQGTEYFISAVNLNTGIYGSTFYMITGLHGAHVLIGTCFLFYCWTAVAPLINLRATYLVLYRISSVLASYFYASVNYPLNNLEGSPFDLPIEDINPVDHYGQFGLESFESAAWYWHFVDVVWIFVFGFVYVWSHLTVLNLQ